MSFSCGIIPSNIYEFMMSSAFAFSRHKSLLLKSSHIFLRPKAKHCSFWVDGLVFRENSAIIIMIVIEFLKFPV